MPNQISVEDHYTGVYIANISKTLIINELHANFSVKIVVYVRNFL